ncbi:UNKNOWN [Stylonychia lemnae]|uniref:Uncharacterized protein n=1 Tax=Stylonychia lemnae TaxID=5949 RepID=A0A077ZSI6_STYLE|nr:UNKNOWN [Stylonychia lemnae]|eukprot:CDW72524.1 UNKNOWN [Stylonychia lemnae]
MAEVAGNNVYKIQRAVKALVRNHTVLVTSGMGMTADCDLPFFRGTYGLWQHYPILNKMRITYDQLITKEFFDVHPDIFWYSRLQTGLHQRLAELFAMQALQYMSFLFDHRVAQARVMPQCQECNKIMRPNINMKHDIDWMENFNSEMNKNFVSWLDRNEKRSKTVIEIGAGPAIPLVRSISDAFLNNDKYRCTLIRINPRRERISEYKWEKEQIEKLINEDEAEKLNNFGEVQINLSKVEELKIPDYSQQDLSYLSKDEDREYQALKNELIEIQMGAEEALGLIKQGVLDELRRQNKIQL